jgi:CHASE3 domain sensor protein
LNNHRTHGEPTQRERFHEEMRSGHVDPSAPNPKYRNAVIVAVLMAVAVMLISEFAYQRAHKALEVTHRAQQIRSVVYESRRLLLGAETGQRGYLITARIAYLQPYVDARATLAGRLERARALTIKDAELARQVSRLRIQAYEKMEELDLVLRTYDLDPESPAWRAIVDSDIGQRRMREILATTDTLLSTLAANERDAIRRIDSDLYAYRVSMVMFTMLNLLAFIVYLRLRLGHDMKEYQRMRWMSGEKDRLERMVGERTAQLAQLSTSAVVVHEQEREALARELHDGVGGALTTAKIDIARLRARLIEDTGALERLDHLILVLDQGVAVQRRIVEALRPSSLSSLGLGHAIEDLCVNYRRDHGMRIECAIERVNLAAEAELALYRLAQLCLTLLSGRADTPPLTIALREYSAYAELTIRDGGALLPVFANIDVQRRFGIARLRIKSLGGSCEFSEQDHHRVRIRASLPIDPNTTASPG